MKFFLAVTISSLLTTSALADHLCHEGSSKIFIDKREDKVQSGVVDFQAESRVQNYSPSARQFVWCIRNTHVYHVAQFMWGTPTEEDKYFHSIVEPGRESEAMRTDSSAIRTGERQIKYKRLNSSQWNKYAPETIFFERIGRPANLLKFAQLSPQTTSDAVSQPDDLEKIGGDPHALNAYIKAAQKVHFSNSITATLPANKRVQDAIESQKYEGYDARDFARVTVYLTGRLVDGPNENPYFNFDVGLRGFDERAKGALKEVPVRVRIGSNDVTARSSKIKLPWERVFDNLARSDLDFVPVTRLAYVDMSIVLSAADTNFVFASLPFRMLLPVDQ